MASKAKVAIYSDDSAVRGAVKAALGAKLAEDLEIETIEFATADAFRLYIEDRKSTRLNSSH